MLDVLVETFKPQITSMTPKAPARTQHLEMDLNRKLAH